MCMYIDPVLILDHNYRDIAGHRAADTMHNFSLLLQCKSCNYSASCEIKEILLAGVVQFTSLLVVLSTLRFRFNYRD
jgi:hypothetical protein